MCTVLPGLGLGTSFHSSAAQVRVVEEGIRAVRAIPASPAERPEVVPVAAEADAEIDAETPVDAGLVDRLLVLDLELIASSVSFHAAEDGSAWRSRTTQSRLHNRGPPHA